MVTPCNGCFASLLKATEYLSEPKTMGDVNKVLRGIYMKYTGIPRVTPEGRRVLEPLRVRHFVEVLYNDFGVDSIKAAVTKSLGGLKVAVHYGCHYLRPTEIGAIEDPENPHMVDDIVRALGAESIDYQNKLDCCGAGGGVRSHVADLAAAISRDKYESIESTGADCILTPCPFCLLQLDTVQEQFEGRKIPVIHFAQLVALAMGTDPKMLGLGLHKVSFDSMISKIGGG
jgi:heterodisulfide reductase subunit B